MYMILKYMDSEVPSYVLDFITMTGDHLTEGSSL